jgi:nucleotide-binding universal stress UspA family protein
MRSMVHRVIRGLALRVLMIRSRDARDLDHETNMFKNILCPIDFTTFSHHALEHAVAIARAYGATLTGVHVVEPRSPGGTSTTASAAELALLRAQVLKKLQEVNAPSPAAFAVIGDPALEIEKLATAVSADLIVIPVDGWTGSQARTCGSVTGHVLCHAPVPVMVVPGTAGSGTTAQGGFQRIACGVNFSPASMTALRYANKLAGPTGARLFVTHVMSADEAVVSPAIDNDSPSGDIGASIWRRRLHEAAHRDLPPAVDVADRLRAGDPTTEILGLAEEEHSDLIVIGAHRGNPAGGVMNGLVTRSHCPVLTLRTPH